MEKKHPALALPEVCRKSDILHDNGVRFYTKPFPFVCATECTLVPGTPHGYLQQNAVGFAGRSDYISLIVQY